MLVLNIDLNHPHRFRFLDFELKLMRWCLSLLLMFNECKICYVFIIHVHRA